LIKRKRFISLLPGLVVLLALLAASCAPAVAPTATPTKAPAAAPTAASKTEPTKPAGTTATTPTAATSKPAAKLKGTEVKIGFMGPKTGPVAAWGIENEEVLKMAEKEINDSGGIGGLPVKFLFFDTQAKPDEAVSLTRKLLSEDKVLMLLGPYLSGEASVAFPIAVSMKAPIFSCCSAAPGVSEKSRPWAFRLPQPDDKGLVAMIKKYVADNNIKKAVTIGDQKDAASKIASTQYIPNALKEAGVQILNGNEPIGYNTGDTSFAAQVTRIKELNPEAMFMYALPAEGGAFIKEVRRQGLKQPMVTGSSLVAVQFLDAGGDAVEGTIMNAVWDPMHPSSKKFVDGFKKLYNKEPTMAGAYTYDAIYIAKQVIETSGATNDPAELAKDWEKIRDGLQNIKFDGATGKSSFDKNGDGVHAVYEAVVKGGKIVVNYNKVVLDAQ